MKMTLLIGLCTVALVHAQADKMLDARLNVAQRNDACVAMRGDRTAEAAGSLRQALADPQVRACAARNLREAGAAEVLRAALEDVDPEVRAVAARELGTLRDSESVVALAHAADDPVVLVAVAAIHALAETRHQSALAPLVAVARRGGIAGLTALQAAATFDDPAVVPVARQYLAGQDVPARVIALGILGRLGSTADLPELQRLAAQAGEPLSARGRGFGFMPPIEISDVARNAVAQIEHRTAAPRP